MKIIIVEDELLIAEMLKEMLIDLEHSILGIAKNFHQAHALFESEKNVDLCFLDINLQEMQSGFDVAQLINDRYKFPFVFLTSYSDKKMIEAAVAFQPQAYLIKPFTEPDLFSTIELLKSKTGHATREPATKHLIIKDGGLLVKLPTQEIETLMSNNVYVEVKTSTKKYLIRNSLSRILDEMNDAHFVRTHRTFAVNIQHVRGVHGQYLLVGNQKIPCSRKHRDDIFERFNQ